MWILLCLTRSIDWIKAFEHTSQTYDFNPEWIFMCLFSCKNEGYSLEQWEHLNFACKFLLSVNAFELKSTEYTCSWMGKDALGSASWNTVKHWLGLFSL